MKAAWLLACSIASARALAFDARIASKTIKSGGIYVLDDWLEPRLARALRDDALALQEAGAFSKSGVSNTAAAASRYGAQDRAVRTLGPSVGGDVHARAELDGLLEGLRAALSERSPGPLTLEEQYYSIHAPGAFLGRHMDERHEACKGEAGFLHDSRRSVSWLVYLQQAKRGGELRAWCRESAGDVGAHEGDVQVGWLPRNRRDAARRRATPRAARRRAAPAATAAPSAVDPSKNRGNPSRSRRAARGFAGPRARPSGFGRFRRFSGRSCPGARLSSCL